MDPYWNLTADSSGNVFFTDLMRVRKLSPSVAVTVTTNPAGLPVTIDGTQYIAPVSTQWATGSTHVIGAVTPVTSGGARYIFSGWSDTAMRLFLANLRRWISGAPLQHVVDKAKMAYAQAD